MKCWKVITDYSSSKLIALPRERKVIQICLLAAIAILVGCAAQLPSPYPDAASLLNAPPPQNRQELTQRCIYLHQEILLQRTKEDTAGIVLPGTTLLSMQQEASRNIAALEARATKLGCDAVSNEQDQPTMTKETGNYIDMCMAKCKQYTNRTPEQCFDSCK